MVRFGDEVEKAGGSEAWRRLIDALPRMVPSGKFYSIIPGASAVVAKQLPKVAGAVEAKDVTGAVVATRAMMRAHGEVLVAEVERRGLI
jgi:hypothetical protein